MLRPFPIFFMLSVVDINPFTHRKIAFFRINIETELLGNFSPRGFVYLELSYVMGVGIPSQNLAIGQKLTWDAFYVSSALTGRNSL